MLVMAKADMNHTVASGDWPLTVASENGHLEVVQLLLAVRADPHHQMPNGLTALISVAFKGQLDVCQFLLECRVDASVKVTGNEFILCDGTALQVARHWGHKKVEALLKGQHNTRL